LVVGLLKPTPTQTPRTTPIPKPTTPKPKNEITHCRTFHL
jgi:hypothetical protein